MRSYVVLALLFFGIVNIGNCQVKGTQFTIDYRTIVNELRSSKNLKALESKWDYESILMLDTSDIRLIYRVAPKVVADYRKVFSYPIDKKYKKVLSTDKSSIEDCIKDYRLYQFDNSLNLKIDYPVYVKDKKVAVLQIYNNGYTECLRITLLKGKQLLVELMYSTIE